MRAGIYQLAYMEKPQQNKSKKGGTSMPTTFKPVTADIQGD